MCGIVGINGAPDVCFDLLAGLKRLEYRGYDSAGVATLFNKEFHRQRAEGKLINLERIVKEHPLPGIIGIGHTRWATHGGPTTSNAHPHQGQYVALVHNGIIENHRELRAGFDQTLFQSETDSEVVVHLLDAYIKKGYDHAAAIQATLPQLKGSYALAVLFKNAPDTLVGICRGSPLVIGHGKEGRLFLASDIFAFADYCESVTYLEEGDWTELKNGTVTIYSHGSTHPVTRPSLPISADIASQATKGLYRHFMLKEIMEQPEVLQNTLEKYAHSEAWLTKMPTNPWKKASGLSIVACGTSFYAGCVAKYWFEEIARLPVAVDIASEYRYRHPALPADSCALFISQSGETADTLAAARFTKQKKIYCASLVNVAESSLAREVDQVFQTYAGFEIGVASTKTFTTQLIVLAALTAEVALLRGEISAEERATLQKDLLMLPRLVEETLKIQGSLQRLAPQFERVKAALYLGRGALYPVALEGALKLKEISYIHAEGYAAGELKHGPIALIDDKIPVVVLAPHDVLFEKILSNVQEVLARKGQVILFTDNDGARALNTLAEGMQVCILPKVCSFLAPIVYTVPMQLLAYHVAAFKGTDIDQPRNLAKSVTVE
ncbi:MAG: glutamine--fructose-6-phosphate transaminase (isomerizing) [Holosporales bacterium]|jgi:glucosamine--fructose-6-phosphate aminotransferase (isomerizing)|nr:glutamine--fructose-6-phosphate transaminase (isomerizing) [Holosporales bacterium]